MSKAKFSRSDLGWSWGNADGNPHLWAWGCLQNLSLKVSGVNTASLAIVCDQVWVVDVSSCLSWSCTVVLATGSTVDFCFGAEPALSRRRKPHDEKEGSGGKFFS